MPKPTIFSINGFMGNMWAGPQADVARHLSDQALNVAYWQPIGYPSQDFPLSTGVAAGIAELKHQRQTHPGPYLLSSWSEGAIIATLFVKDELARGIFDCKGAVAFGNPYRAAGQWAPKTGIGSCPDPGGAGIGGHRNNWAAPDWWHNYAHGTGTPYDGVTGVDIYTCCPADQSGDDMRVIMDFALTQWTGLIEDLWDFATDLIHNPAHGVISVIEAVVDAIRFYGGQQRPHQNYSPNAGMNYLAGIARAL